MFIWVLSYVLLLRNHSAIQADNYSWLCTVSVYIQSGSARSHFRKLILMLQEVTISPVTVERVADKLFIRLWCTHADCCCLFLTNRVVVKWSQFK